MFVDGGGSGIELRGRTELVDGDGTWDESVRAGDVVAVLESGEAPQDVAAALIAEEGESDEELAEDSLEELKAFQMLVTEGGSFLKSIRAIGPPQNKTSHRKGSDQNRSGEERMAHLS